MTALVATGLLLSMALAGCARQNKAGVASPSAIAVDPHIAPPADLLVCPDRPVGFPADASATMPPAVRQAIVRLATAYGAAVGQLERLIGWETGAACSASAAKP